jgi:hypothetical protein
VDLPRDKVLARQIDVGPNRSTFLSTRVRARPRFL